MIEVSVTPEILSAAKIAAARIGELRNSITAGDGNVAGMVGKYIVSQYLGTPITKTYNYDIIHNSKRLEVKTKRCTSKPFGHYECSIAEFNPDQKCDYYVFVRVLNDMSKAWILGVMTPDEYFATCTTHEAGTRDPKNNFTFHCKSYNLPINQLHEIDTLLPAAKPTPVESSLDMWSK